MFSTTKKHERMMTEASSYDEWKHAAKAYDQAAKNNDWKQKEASGLFDYRSIRTRLETLKTLRIVKDYQGLLFALNEGIHGNVGGIGKAELYEKSKVGTKVLIETYIDEVAACLKVIADKTCTINEQEKLSFFRRARLCFGQTALMMSGSGTLAYFHLGVAKTLWQQDLLPTVLSGSSGGALIGAIFASRSDDELHEYFEPKTYISDGDTIEHWFEKYKFKIISPESYRQLVNKLIPNVTFEQAFDKTGRALNISIAPASTHQTSRLLNAITTPNVLIREAIMASSAIPGVFPPITLKALDRQGNESDYLPHRQWVDGAISDDLPAKRLSRLYGVNHFIVSQTNPHILPFISQQETGVTSILTRAVSNTARVWINAGANVFNTPLTKVSSIERFSSSILSVINQDYMGDINILPPFKFKNPARLLAPLTLGEISELIQTGERSTWPKVDMIRIQTQLSRLLQSILNSQYKNENESFHSDLMRVI